MKKQSGIFYGWIMVIVGFILTGASVGLMNNCNGILVKPVTESMGYLRSEFTLYPTIATLVSMALLPLFSELYTRFNLKKMLLICSLVAVGCLIAYSFATSIWHFYGIAFIYGVVMNGVSMTIVGLLVNNWFTDKKGLTSGIAFAGSGFFAALAVPIVTMAIDNYGWRWGYRVLGGGSLLFLIPVILLLVKVDPAEMGLQPYTEGSKDSDTTYLNLTLVGITKNEAIKTPCFWLFMASSFIVGFVNMGVQPHTMAYLTDIGYDNSFASFMVSVIMIGMIVGKLALGYLFDKVGALRGSMIGSGASLVAVILILFAERSTAIVWMYAIVIGMACSTGSVALNYLTASYFGDLDFKRILPLITMASMLGVAVGNPLSGLIYDISGSYTNAWLMYLGFATAGVILFYLTYISSTKLSFNSRVTE